MIPLDGFWIWLKFYFSTFGIFCPFVLCLLVFMEASKIKLITHLSFYCSHFEWPEISHAGVSRPLSELIRFLSSSVEFSYYGNILTEWNRSNLLFWGIIFRKQWSLKFVNYMYFDHLQNCLEFGHGLLIFFILVLLWLSETGQIWRFSL